MTVLWFISGAALLVAIVAFIHARRSAKQLAQLSQNYWELKYQYGELRVRLQQLTGEPIAHQPDPPAAPPARDSFVPLSSLKR